jgi:hypothetical protein
MEVTRFAAPVWANKNKEAPISVVAVSYSPRMEEGAITIVGINRE